MLKNHRVPQMPEYHQDGFGDMFLLYAREIEYALLKCGAEYGKDYDLKMLFELAQPFVLALNEKQLLKTEIDC